MNLCVTFFCSKYCNTVLNLKYTLYYALASQPDWSFLLLLNMPTAYTCRKHFTTSYCTYNFNMLPHYIVCY